MLIRTRAEVVNIFVAAAWILFIAVPITIIYLVGGRPGLAIVMSAVGIAGAAAVFRRGIRLEDDGLVLVAVLRTKRIAWTDVAGFEMSGKFWFESWGRVITRSGKRWSLPGIVVFGRQPKPEPSELEQLREAWRAAIDRDLSG